MVIKWVSRPNKEKYAYRHTCPFILLPYAVKYPLNCLLIFLEQFCHPLPNELDHCALYLKLLDDRKLKIFRHNLPIFNMVGEKTNNIKNLDIIPGLQNGMKVMMKEKLNPFHALNS